MVLYSNNNKKVVVKFWKCCCVSTCVCQGRIQKIQKEGAESSTPEWKLHFSGLAAYSIVGVFMMQSKAVFQIELKIILWNDFQSKNRKTFWNYKKTGGPWPPWPLNPPMSVIECRIPPNWVGGCKVCSRLTECVGQIWVSMNQIVPGGLSRVCLCLGPAR